MTRWRLSRPCTRTEEARMGDRISTALELGGLALVSAGAFSVSVTVGLVVAGLSCVLVGVAGERR